MRFSLILRPFRFKILQAACNRRHDDLRIIIDVFNARYSELLTIYYINTSKGLLFLTIRQKKFKLPPHHEK